MKAWSIIGRVLTFFILATIWEALNQQDTIWLYCFAPFFGIAAWEIIRGWMIRWFSHS